MLATMATAESSSNSTPGSSNSTGNDTTFKQMGICQAGVKRWVNGLLFNKMLSEYKENQVGVHLNYADKLAEVLL